MDRTQPGEVPQGCRTVLRVVDLAVVELQVVPPAASLDRALTTADDHRGPQLGRDVPPEVRHRTDVLALLDDRSHERGAEQGPYPFDTHGTDTRDLTRLVTHRVPAHERRLIDHDMRHVTTALRPGPGPGLGPGRSVAVLFRAFAGRIVAHRFRERICCIRVLRLAHTRCSGLAESTASPGDDQRIDRA